ncbi:MAG: SCO7613 C-terminal domain-containing membrane protein [Acidimicrobiales bacterium]
MAQTPILTPVPRSRTARSAASWLAGTGALLLLAAAAVLVAMQWDDIAAVAKLAGLVVVNGGIVAAGLRYRLVVPATARALHHLGALMIPVSVAAVTIHAGLAWEHILLATTVLGTAGIAALDRLWSSAILQGVVAAAVVPFAGAVAALTPVPPAFVLAAAALAAALRLPARGSVWWTAVVAWAALAPSLALIAGVDDPLIATSDVAAALGLTGAVAGWTHLVAGIVAGIAMGMLARRDDDIGLGLGALCLPMLGAAAWLSQSEPAFVGVVTVAIFGIVGLQLVAASLRDGSFWQRVIGPVLPAVEVALAIATAYLLVFSADAGEPGSPLGSIAAAVSASVIAAVGWVLADHRRRVADCQSTPMALLAGSGWAPATVAIAASLLAGIVALDLTPTVALAAVVVLAAALVASGRGGAHEVAATLATGAVFGAMSGDVWSGNATAPSDLAAAAITVAAAAVLAWAASMRGPRGDLGAMVLTAGSVLWAPLAAARAFDDTNLAELVGSAGPALTWMTAVVLATVSIVVAERGSNDPIATRTGLPARLLVVAAFVPLFFGADADHVLPAAVLVAALVAIDLMRSRDLRLGAPLLVLGPAVASAALSNLALSGGRIGVVLAIAAAGVAGITFTLGDRRIGDAAAIGLAVAAFVHAANSPSHLSTVLILLGVAVVVSELLTVTPERVVAAGALVTLGVWLRLDLEGIDWAAAWIAPLALTIVGIAVAARGAGVSSWLTTGPAVGLVGFAALGERVLFDGAGGHAVAAGIVAVAAIVAGAHLRLAGPLVVGTAVLVATVAHESFGYAAGVPTWAWLAAGGATLLGAGIAVERGATTPVESARRTVTMVCADFR